jgi:serine O-acetyltransferase
MDLKKLTEITSQIISAYEKEDAMNRIDGKFLPSPDNIVKLTNQIHTLLFPGILGNEVPGRGNFDCFIQSLLDQVFVSLAEQIQKSLNVLEDPPSIEKEEKYREQAEDTALKLLNKLPEIRELLNLDIEAAYDGDPAVKYMEEIILCYPSIRALTTHRIAHELYTMGIPLIARIISEWVHSETGIDIHPGARIGKSFFMDHGTGIVIGETTVIGDHVKIYQGVTLGALSFDKDPAGEIVKGGQRHPRIEDDVTIYANATILGGKTVIGKGSVIGANTWITSSIPPSSRVTISVNQELIEKGRQK